MRGKDCFSIALLSMFCLQAAACIEPDAGDDALDEASSRCAEIDIGLGLVGLAGITVDGTARITGAFPHLFSNGSITLSGLVTVDGSAVSALGVLIGGQPPAGSVVEDSPPITVADPSADILAAKAANNNTMVPCVQRLLGCRSPVIDGVLTLEGLDNVILPAGTYHFKSIKATGFSRLGVNGSVRVYLDGGASFSGGSATNVASDSLTVVTNAIADVELTGAGSAVMHIFAPKGAVKVTGATIFKGSLIGKTVGISGSAVVHITTNVLSTLFAECEPDPEPEPEPEPDPDPDPDHGTETGLDGCTAEDESTTWPPDPPPQLP